MNDPDQLGEDSQPETSYCENCGKKLPPEDSRKRFCSTECFVNSLFAIEVEDEPDSEATERMCVGCGKSYRPRVSNQQYCTSKCRTAGNVSSAQHKRPPKNCAHCGALFQPRSHNQKFCSHGCSELSQAEKGQKQPSPAAECETCGKHFARKSSNERFCSIDCRVSQPRRCKECGCELQSAIEQNRSLCDGCRSAASPKNRVTPRATLPPFLFRDKCEFHEWFNVSFPLFGIKELIRSDDRFPNVTCRTFTGDTLRVHLELLSSLFRHHQDRLSEVDLVICAIRRPKDRTMYGVPVFGFMISEITGDSFEQSNLRLSPEAEKMFRSNVRFMVDDADD